MKTSDELDVLRRFRLSLYGFFDRCTDALFDLTDAILTAGVVPSPVHLCLQRGCIVAAGAAYTPR